MPARDAWGKELLRWFEVHRRDLPWRRTNDPYAIWVSEVMLQQTQVTTVLRYWQPWMALFPSVNALASAEDSQVLSAWEGLGYYKRCRMLMEGARWVDRHGVPQTAPEWKRVPGVGAYTAAAIASIANKEAVALVDGNVRRVYARFTGDSSCGAPLDKAAWSWAQRNLDSKRPGDWNQALMELGATTCKPKQPLCQVCPIRTHCIAFETGCQSELPGSAPKRSVVRIRSEVWVPVFEGRLGLRQIPEGRWWSGMWEFPRVEHDGPGEPQELREIVGEGWLEAIGSFKHSVTHHRITVVASMVQCESRSDALVWFEPSMLAGLPMPAPQRRVLKLYLANVGAGAR